MRMLDLFAGRLGWSKAFLARGWKVTAVDLIANEELFDMPRGLEFYPYNVLGISHHWIAQQGFDFICASPPCEEFSVHGMKCFHPNPAYPHTGVRLFTHTVTICEKSGVPYIIENVRSAQKFVGQADAHAGSFYLWGNAIPPQLPKRLVKGFRHTEMFAHNRPNRAKASATIPPELANCVAEYAERIQATQEAGEP